MKNIKMGFTIIIAAFALSLMGCQASTDTISENKPIEADSAENQISNAELDLKAIENELDAIVSDISDFEDKDEVSQILASFEEKDLFSFQFVYIANESGTYYLWPSTSLPEDYDARERVWYIESMKEGLYVSDSYQDAETGKNFITVAKKITTDGKDIGVIGIDVFILDKSENTQ